jgi:cysteinyl-tRNA synthetase
MSKSLGNFFTLRDLIEKGFTGREIRYVLINAHYRSALNFAFDALEDARKSLARIDECVDKCTNGVIPDWAKVHIDNFTLAVNDDLNLPKAFASLFELVRETNSRGGNGVLGAFEKMDEVLGVIFFGKREDVSIPEDVQKLLEERALARQNKDWARSDYLRDEIAKLGYTVKDSKEGQKCTLKI